MSLFRLLSAVLCIAVQCSLCTGGILSFSAAAADYIASPDDSEGALMSYAPVDFLSCLSSSIASPLFVDQVDDDVSSKSGCTNSETCIDQVSRDIRERSSHTVSSVAVCPPTSFHTSFLLHSLDSYFPSIHTRDGPLHEYAYILSRSVLNRE